MEEKKEEIVEQEIVILHKGIDLEEMAGPRGICCRGPMFPFRG